jgi:hypothetical protein
MKTYEMTIEQIFAQIKNGEANVDEIVVCGKLINPGNDPFYIEIKGAKIIGYKKLDKGYEIDKVTLVKDTPDAEIMKLAARIKESAMYLRSIEDNTEYGKNILSL